MGKGDQRSRRGKIHRGTFGKRRPKKVTHTAKPATSDESSEKGTKKEPAASE